MRTRILVAFLIIGIIIGPVYSISLYYKDFSSPLVKNYDYFTTEKSETFNTLNKTYLSSPSTHNVLGSGIFVYNNSIYSLEAPATNISGYSADNHVNTNAVELLEINTSNNFNSIVSSTNYLLQNFTIKNPLDEYSRPFFDGKLFWAVQHTFISDVSNPLTLGFQPNLLSFNKQGDIISNVTLNLHVNDSSSEFAFLGKFENYFFISDYSQVGTLHGFVSHFYLIVLSYNKLLFSIDLINKTFTPENIQIIPIGNIDNNGELWLTGGNFRFGISLNELLSTRKIKIDKIISSDSISSVISSYNKDKLNLLSFQNGYYYYKGLPIYYYFELDNTVFFIYQNKLIYLSLLPLNLLNDGLATNMVLGFGSIKFNNLMLSQFDFMVIILGYTLFILEALIITYRYWKNKKSLSTNKTT